MQQVFDKKGGTLEKFTDELLLKLAEVHSSDLRGVELVDRLQELETERELNFGERFVAEYWNQQDSKKKPTGVHDALRSSVNDHIGSIGGVIEEEFDRAAVALVNDSEEIMSSPVLFFYEMDPAVLAALVQIFIYNLVLSLDEQEVAAKGVRPITIAEEMAPCLLLEFKKEKLRLVGTSDDTHPSVKRSIDRFFKKPSPRVAKRLWEDHGINGILPTEDQLLAFSLWLIDKAVDNSGETFRRDMITKEGYFITVAPSVLDLVAARLDNVSVVRPGRSVLFAPPLEWEKATGGGRMLQSESIMTGFNLSEKNAGNGVAALGDWSEHELALNHHQNTSWKINERVLSVMNVIWNKYPEGKAGFKRHYPVDVPCKEENPTEYYRARKVNRQIIAPYKNMMQRRLDFGYKLGDIPFWYSLTVDSRGRLKYLSGDSPNPHGSDDCRGMLKLAYPAKLGKDGVYWLKVGLGTLAGNDKAGFDERAQWTEENEKLLRNIAAKPTSKAAVNFLDSLDEPWQFLANVFSYVEALQNPDGPEAYGCSTLIPFDATCSGFQIISSLLGDEEIMKATNVIPYEDGHRGDLYNLVGDEMHRLLKDDDSWYKTAAECADKNDEFSVAKLQTLWADGVPRLAAKRVMTSGYGSVSIFGQAEGFSLITADLFPEYMDPLTNRSKRTTDGGLDSPEVVAMPDKDEEILLTTEEYFERFGRGVIDFRLRAVMAKLLLASIKTRVPSLYRYLQWIRDLALSASAKNCSVSWYSPSGILIDQRYNVEESQQVRVEGLDWSVHKKYKTDAIDGRKCATALAPNFIHSLDASFLVQVVNKFMNETPSMSVASVHDCMLVSPAYTGDFLRIVREVFRDMLVSRNHLKTMYEMTARKIKAAGGQDPDQPFPEMIEQKTQNFDAVIQSEFFWS